MAEAENLEDSIRNHVRVLASDLGERNFVQYQNLEKAADYIKQKFKSFGFNPQEHLFSIENRNYRDIIAIKEGKNKKQKVIIVCAHYDSVWGSPGADDNASAVASLLELSRLLSSQGLNKTIKFIAFANEEPPFYLTDDMGSFRYAREARRREENIEAVLCLESVGYYSDSDKSQSYPLGLSFFYPDRGNFIAIVSNLSSKNLLKRIVNEFKNASDFPVEYLSAPTFLAPAISLSDHSSFWKFGYKAVMITDTAFYRNPYYHSAEDTADKLNYQNISKVTEGLYKVLLKLAEAI